MKCILKNPHPDTGSEGENLLMASEHVLFIPVPGSNKVTTKGHLIYFGSAVDGILK